MMDGGGWGRLPEGNAEETAAILKRKGPVAETEVISEPVEMGETMMMGLRLMEGVSGEGFKARFGRKLECVFGEDLGELEELGLLEHEEDYWRLTSRGKFLGNEVFQRFVSVGV